MSYGVFLFFFFKQKTAYEMRISDWSSDVCSSDLALRPRWAQDGGRAAMLKRFDDSSAMARMRPEIAENLRRRGGPASLLITSGPAGVENRTRSEERRGGKSGFRPCRSRWSPHQ